MQRPNGYDKVQAGFEKRPEIEVGGHYMRILGAEIKINKYGREMLVVSFDIAEPDKQAGFFLAQYKADDRVDKPWPHLGTNYINVLDFNGDCSRSFKGFCTAIEQSNNGFKVQFTDENDKDLPDEVFCRQFKNKAIGGVFGSVENFFNGKKFWRSELRWFCKSDDAPSRKVPDPKPLKNATGVPVSAPMQNNQPAEDAYPF